MKIGNFKFGIKVTKKGFVSSMLNTNNCFHNGENSEVKKFDSSEEAKAYIGYLVLSAKKELEKMFVDEDDADDDDVSFIYEIANDFIEFAEAESEGRNRKGQALKIDFNKSYMEPFTWCGNRFRIYDWEMEVIKVLPKQGA